MKYYDRDGGVGAVTTVTVPGDRNYLILDTQDTCKRREFVIQAVINNELQSENRSVISNLNGKCNNNMGQYISASVLSVNIHNFSSSVCKSVGIIASRGRKYPHHSSKYKTT